MPEAASERPRRGLTWLRRVAKALVFSTATLVIASLAAPPSYRFPESLPFAGPRWHHPSETGSGRWLRANFHAHSVLVPGITSGTAAPDVVREAYRKQNYDVHAICNYQSVTPPGPEEEIYVPCYEHGFNVFKAHHTVLGAARAHWLDLPLFQTLDAKQWILDVIGSNSQIVIVNHPNVLRAFSEGDLARLTGYQALEVRSKFAKAIGHWDAALSAGRLVWGMTADDGHDPSRKSHVGIGWLLVRVKAATPDALYAALRAGRFHSVFTRHGAAPNRLVESRLSQESGGLFLTIDLAEPADAIRFRGQGGNLLSEVENRRSASYLLQPSDSYVRIEASTRGTQIYLNPAYRYEGADPYARARQRATVGRTRTAIRRALGSLAIVGAFWLLYLRRGGAGRG